ncbi:MAG: potassium transporter [Cereibacter sphaeroides]|uniref:Potassium transporter n=1 Tax=Cereibacter sphaeroides TaxID=1063 RepID=A0A2W5S447_CERSP|nr:MAG: potassium transporter [Cereibacter sphaeroides]
MESLLSQAIIYLGAAVLLVPIVVRLGLGSVLGYLCAGIVIGPVLGLAGAETQDVQHFAEFGVVMMLFLVGLELEPRALWDMRQRLVGLGGLQVVLTSLAIMAGLLVLGLDWPVALTLGMMLSLSSTAIVLQTLEEKNLIRSRGGRSIFAVLLTQDISVVPILALMPILAGMMPSAPVEAIEGLETDPSLVQSLPGWAGALLILAVVGGIVFGGHYLSRPVFRFVHAAHMPEMSTFTSLLMVVGIAVLMSMVGLSPALGTFLAGVVLANSEFRHQLEADIAPMKGLLMGLFFMTVGARIDFAVLAAQPFTIIGLTLAILTLKVGILMGLGHLFGLRGSDRLLFGCSLAQGGEFAFLLAGVALTQGLLTPELAQMALLVIGLSMLLTPALFLAEDRLALRLVEKPKAQQPDDIDQTGRVIIAGIGRFGQVVNRLVRTSGVETVVLDADMTTLETMRRFGVKGFFGDPTRLELLEAAGLAKAQVLVVAVDTREAATRIVQLARAARPDIHIVARARDRVHVYELYQAGANDIVRELFDSSVRAGRYVLENVGFSEYEASRMAQTYWRVDRHAMRELAELWVPGQPVHLNAAYVERSKQLERDFETALITDLDEAEAKAAE